VMAITVAALITPAAAEELNGKSVGLGESLGVLFFMILSFYGCYKCCCSPSVIVQQMAAPVPVQAPVYIQASAPMVPLV
jgi:hypothetical protein